MDQCRNCLPGHGCWSIKTWTGYGVSSYGTHAEDDWSVVCGRNGRGFCGRDGFAI